MSSRRRLAGLLHGTVHSGWQRRKEQSKNMDRKWRCERNARGPRGPPRQFPAVCPCEAVCAGFPTRVASLPLPAPETALSRPVWRVCEGSRKSAAPPGRGKNGGRKRCRKKQWRLWAASANYTVPQCGAGRRVTGFRTRSQFQGPAPLVAPLFVECPPSGAFAAA